MTTSTSGGSEVTVPELARRLDAFHREYQQDRSERDRRHRDFVLQQVYAADQLRRDDQIAALKVALEAERQGREADRVAFRAAIREEKNARKSDIDEIRGRFRWWWTAVVAPVLILVAQFLFAKAGGS